MSEKTRVLLRYGIVIHQVVEDLNEKTGEWEFVDQDVSYEEEFAVVEMVEVVEGAPNLRLGDKVLNLAKACARGYLKGVECPKWEVPE